MNEFKKVLISMPSNGFIKTETVHSLVNMLACSPVQYQFFAPMSCYIHMNREQSIEAARQMDAEYILFLDADMLFPPDALLKLLTLNKDIATVTYNYRSYPPRSIIQLDEKYDADYEVDDSVTERPIPLNKIKNPFRIAHGGGGFLLVKMEVFDNMPRPWFFFEPQTETTPPVGEDVWFCEKARANGYEIWCDPSIQMGHIGSTIF